MSLGPRTAAARAALAVVLFALCAAVAAASAAAGAPSILLVTLDTTRADRIGAYGYPQPVTPTIDRLAREGVLFESAIAPTPLTLPSHASMLLGVTPPQHGVHGNALYTLDPRATLVSEVLQRRGWRTGAFVGTFMLDARFGLDQGFETYRGPQVSRLTGAGHVERPANEVVDEAVAWFRTLEPGERFFAWIHFYDPHHPYTPPEAYARRFEDPYDGEIAFCDAQLGRLLGFLDREGLSKNLLVAVTADHGESLGDHGEGTHGVFIYQATLHVPLVFSGAPVAKAKGRRVPGFVSTADLTPTLLRVAGVPASEMPESKQVSLLAQDGVPQPVAPERPVYVETYMPYHDYRWRALRGLLLGGDKLVQGRQAELYALDADPNEALDRAGDDPARVRTLQKRLTSFQEAHRPLGWVETRDVAAGERALLESLGYVASSGSGDPFAPDLPDPRERLEDLNSIATAVALFQQGQALSASSGATAVERRENQERGRAMLESAKRLLESVRSADPANPQIPMHLAAVEGALGNYEAAISLLHQALKHQPKLSLLHYNLATTYYKMGRRDEALAEIRIAIDLEPYYPRYYRWISTFYAQEGRFDEAKVWLDRMSGLAEEGTEAHQQVGRWIAEVRAEMRRRGHEPGS